jgi:hypothetical protein
MVVSLTRPSENLLDVTCNLYCRYVFSLVRHVLPVTVLICAINLLVNQLTSPPPDNAGLQNFGRAQLPRGLRRGSAAARVLGLGVRITPGAWMSALVSVVCCQVGVSATGRSLVQRSRTDCSQY